MKDRNYYISRGISSKSKPQKSKVKILFLVFILVISTIIISKMFPEGNQVPQKLISPLAKSSPLYNIIKKNDHSDTNQKTIPEDSISSLLQNIEDLISKKPGTYSIYIYDINHQKGFGINEKTILTAASLYKVPVIAALYHFAQTNEIDLDKVIVPQNRDIQDWGTGSIRYDPPGTSYSIKTLARLMMEKSDNTAGHILNNLIVGTDRIQELIESWGLTQTNIKNNETSAMDMGILFVKIFNGEITSQALTQEMLGFMDKSDFDDTLPLGLPEGVTIYHKTGDETRELHDAGIIDLPDRPYFLGVLTTDITDREQTKHVLSDISKIVYEFMSDL